MTVKIWKTEWIPKAYDFSSVTDPTTSSPSPFTSPSPEDAEVMALMDLLTWPEPQGMVKSSTSPLNCEWQILHPKYNYSVGETLEVVLTAKDHWNQSKTYGGDFFRAKLHSPKLKAGVRGLVTDHQNGTYTISFLLLWPGDLVISIRLFHSSEAVQVIRKARDSRPDKVYFSGIFQRNGTEENTECNLEIVDRPLCVYGDQRIAETWVCVRPKFLPCDSLVYHIFGGYRKVTDAAEDKLLDGQLTNQELPIKIPLVHVITRNSSLGHCRKDRRRCNALVTKRPGTLDYECC